MKIWVEYGSEHSARLRLIGHFKTPEDADRAHRQLQSLCELVADTYDHDRFDDNPMALYLDRTLCETLAGLGCYHFSPEDIASLIGEHQMDRRGNDLRVWTNEFAVSGLIKFMIDRPVRVELYSEHHFPEEGT